jgi:sphingomyelin phosphodiesterase acid-like 3
MYLKVLGVVALAIMTQTSFAEPAIQTSTTPTEKFLTISDVHFDPFASCRVMAISPCPVLAELKKAPWQEWHTIFEKFDSKYSTKFGNDTNYSLLKSSIEELKNLNSQIKPRFGFFLGDFLAHNFHAQYMLYGHDLSKEGYEEFVKKTFEFLTHEYVEAVPDLTIYPAVGNNDAYEDYAVIVNGKLLNQQGTIWAQLIHDKTNREIFENTFPTGGYYSVKIPDAKNQRIIVLDSVLFTRHISEKKTLHAATTQLAWLRNQLEQAESAHESVILAYHIPVGVDVYATLQGFLNHVVQFWQDDDTLNFENIVKQYASTIKIILSGHIHRDTFQIIRQDEKLAVPVSFTPSISPIYGNNPAFKIYTYEPTTLTIKDFETYYLPITTPEITDPWKVEYSFNSIYQKSCQNCDLITGMNNLTPRGESASFFKQFYGVSVPAQSAALDRVWNPYYWCDVSAISNSEYFECIGYGS